MLTAIAEGTTPLCRSLFLLPLDITIFFAPGERLVGRAFYRTQTLITKSQHLLVSHDFPPLHRLRPKKCDQLNAKEKVTGRHLVGTRLDL